MTAADSDRIGGLEAIKAVRQRRHPAAAAGIQLRHRTAATAVAEIVADPDAAAVNDDPGRAIEAVAPARQGPHPAAAAGIQLRHRTAAADPHVAAADGD